MGTQPGNLFFDVAPFSKHGRLLQDPVPVDDPIAVQQGRDALAIRSK